MFDELIKYYLEQFMSLGEPALRAIINCTVPSKIILEKYKTIDPIETLPYDKKKELWLFAQEMYPNETNKEELKRVCKVIHCVGSFI